MTGAPRITVNLFHRFYCAWIGVSQAGCSQLAELFVMTGNGVLIVMVLL